MHEEGAESAGGLQEANALVETAAPEAPETVEGGAAEVTSEETSEPKFERVRDTVARALEQEKKKLAGDASTQEGQKPQAQPVKAEGKPGKVRKDKEPFDPEMFPPERLRAAEKELFNQLPMPLKKAWHRAIKDLESVTTRSALEHSKATGEARGVIEAVQPFAVGWAERGFTVPAAVAALAAANEKLLNEETREQTFLSLGKDLGIDWGRMAAIASGAAPAAAPQSLSSHPEISALREELNALKSEREQIRSKQLSETVQSIAAEMAAVRDETDATGHYLYPEMHDDGFFERVKPLVSALRGNTPGLSYGDALKRAYSALTGKHPGASTQVNQPSLPPQDTQTQSRALSAAVSVRGRIAPQVSGMTMPDKIPDSVRETTKLALEQLRRGT